MGLFVQKYGGTSVGNLERIKAIAKYLASEFLKGHSLLVVVSAMGQQTDELLQMALKLNSYPPQREVDMLLSAGERISMSLLAIALSELHIPTVSFTGSQSGILTDNVFGNARIKRILGSRIKAALEQNKLVIVAGFQGMSEFEKEITTLGRGGSDLTAIALAHVLKADRCQIFKDVDGVCTADPRIAPDAKVLKQLSWENLSTLTWFGSGVVHNRGVHLAKKFKIPLEIRSSFNLEVAGTVIGSHKKVESAILYAITHRQDLSWLCIRNLPINLSHIVFKILANSGDYPLYFQQSKVSIDLVISSKYVTILREAIYASASDVEFSILEGELSCITMVGDGFWQDSSILEKIGLTMDREPLLMDCKNSSINIFLPNTSVLEQIKKFHRQFFV